MRSWRSPSIDQTILSLIRDYGIPAVALLIFLGELGVPTIIPVEVALLLVGSHAVHSPMALVAALLLVTIADLLGTTILHFFARSAGVRLLERLMRGHASGSTRIVGRWRDLLGNREALAVFVGRLLPLIRMSVALGAGLLRISVRSFLLGAAPAALLWAGTPLILGYLFHADVRRFEARYQLASHAIMFALPALSLTGGLVWWIRRCTTPLGQLRRGRAALGLLAAAVTAAYLIKVALASEAAADHGLAAAAFPVLLRWLGALTTLTVVLLGLAFGDMRLARRDSAGWPFASRPVAREVAITLTWLASVGGVGSVIAEIERRYPML